VLVVASGYEPTFFPKTDPLKGPFEARIKPRFTSDIPPKNVILGRVLDPAGAPVDKAVVSVDMVQQGNLGRGSPPAGTDPLAITDEKGEFAIYSREAFDHMQLKVTARAMAPKRFNTVRGGSVRKDLTVTEGASLRGRVLLNGKPLKDVSVGAVSVDRSENFSGDYEYGTREDGTFLFPNLPPDREYFIYGMLKSFLEHGALPARQVRIQGDGTVADVGDLSVVPGHRLAGRMVLSEDKPLPPDARLTIGRREAWDVFALDLPPSGEFSVPNLPAESLTIGGGVKGYRFSGQNASLDRLNPFGLAGRLDQDKTNLVVLLEPGDRLPSEWEALPPEERPENQPLSGIEGGARRKVWVITGRIIDAETKQGIDRARVTSARANGGRTNWLRWETTRFAVSSNGFFRLEVPPGKDPRLIKVIARDHLPALSGLLTYNPGVSSLTGSEALAYPPGESVVNFELKRGQGPSGILLSTNGQPVAGLTIYLLASGEQGGLSRKGLLSVHNGGDECKAMTSPEGAFKFPARLGNAELFASNEEGFLRAIASEIKPGQALRLQPWSRLRGVLVRDGQPVADENVDLQSTDGFSPNSPHLNLHGTVTDETGAFEIENVPPGKMAIALRDTSFGGGGWTSIPIKFFEAPAGEEINLGFVTKTDARANHGR
jgi:uncharacterized GH25 family protein